MWICQVNLFSGFLVDEIQNPFVIRPARWQVVFMFGKTRDFVCTIWCSPPLDFPLYIVSWDRTSMGRFAFTYWSEVSPFSSPCLWIQPSLVQYLLVVRRISGYFMSHYLVMFCWVFAKLPLFPRILKDRIFWFHVSLIFLYYRYILILKTDTINCWCFLINRS